MENGKVQSDSSETYDVQDKKKDCIGMLDMHAHLFCLSEEYRGRLTKQELSALAAQELAARREYRIDTVFSCGTPQEWEFMRQCLESGEGDEQPEKWDGGIFSGRYSPDDFRTADRDRINDSGTSEKQAAKQNGSFMFSFGIHLWYSDRFDPQDCRELFMASPIVGEIGMDSVWCEVPLAVQRRVFAQQLEIAAELKKPIVLHTKGQERQIAEMIRDFPGRYACIGTPAVRRSLKNFWKPVAISRWDQILRSAAHWPREKKSGTEVQE